MNPNQFNQLERIAQRDARRLVSGRPKVEEISPKEIYLLDEHGHRTRRICGKLDEEEWPCIYTAGQGTLHEGIGWCKRHESGLVGKKDYLDRLINVLDKDSELTKFISDSKETDDPFDIEKLARLVEAVLTQMIHSNQFNWSKKEILLFLDIVDQFRRLIETQQKKEANKLVADAITIWIRSVLNIIFNSVSPETYSKITNQISSIELPKEIESVDFVEVK